MQKKVTAERMRDVCEKVLSKLFAKIGLMEFRNGNRDINAMFRLENRNGRFTDFMDLVIWRELSCSIILWVLRNIHNKNK